MNKLLLIAFMALAVVGCKKDASQVVKVNDHLMGKWTVQSNKITYYDQTGQKEYEEMLEGGSIINEISFMKSLKASLVTRDREVLTTGYNLAEEKSLIYIELFDASIFEAHVWKIVDISANDMIWEVNFSDIKYEDKDTGEIIEAPKAILILKFSKQ
uniref:hypothetical protein n=1 Tax=Pedobacter schmidteae TaxID=2201271 RepID=UPI000EB1D97F|nr:hypothetical protein [Pedobacter schmidteae]